MKVLMAPHINSFHNEESGIKRVVEAYFKHLPQFGIELVELGQDYDIKAIHAGTAPDADVAHTHGLYWTADYQASAWEWKANSQVIHSIRHAKEVTVPSDWVAETFRRDMRFNPHVIGHGIDWEEYAIHNEPKGDFVLWNKNRSGDVCDPMPVTQLARLFPKGHFVSTFVLGNKPSNMNVIGVIPHHEMKRLVQSCVVYLATTKETFGIGILEAMAAGKPVLGYAHGGILEMVQHGVNGYLAEPGNIDDLAQGLAWCLEHRDVLGANGQEIAREFTWQRVCEQVANVYRLAAVEERPTVAVVIPSYNYADKVEEAIESAVKQDYDLLTDIIVVDDGSTDNGATKAVVSRWSELDSRVHYIRQNNSGVANARNRGIEIVKTKYVVPLDADDKIAPNFVSTCIPHLENDNSLGIAYTGLYYTTPDGDEGLSPWPGEFDYDKHLKAQNQIPTCCVFRRKMWERLGGYKQRYAPRGAGEEDAEFWLRCGAYGWNAKKVTNEGLFLYSWQSGYVSGAKDHAVTDWRGYAPYVKDGQHPFASVAKPNRFAHPVRQYDEPVVSVIIPVGFNHVDEVTNALDSLEAQTFRKWEAIVVWDYWGSPDDDVPIGYFENRISTQYPYVRQFSTCNEKNIKTSQGTGRARNVGAHYARAPFLLFLDADDHLYPEALEKMLNAWDEHGPAAIYTDYVGKAIIDDVSLLAPDLQSRVYQFDDKTKEAIIGYKAFDYDCERAQRQPEGDRPYIWCNITTLVPKTWHNEIGGFDESLQSWEDVDYWWRMAHAGKCFHRIREELLVYKFYTGGRRDQGVKDYKHLIDYLSNKYKGVQKMGCSGCGNKNRQNRSPQMAVIRSKPVEETMDQDWVLCDYVHPNRALHTVIGATVFDRQIGGVTMQGHGAGFKIVYGQRGQGDRFLVHKLDLAKAPHIFIPVKERIMPVEEKVLPPEPKQIEPVQEEKPPVVERKFEPMPEPKPIVAKKPIVKQREKKFDLQALPGVNSDIARQLRDDGIDTPEDILELGVEGLKVYKGIGKKRAEMILGAIQKAMEKNLTHGD